MAGEKLSVVRGLVPCWLVITQDGHFTYTSDADSHAISGYRIHANGKISLLNANGVTAMTPSDTFPLEEALSSIAGIDQMTSNITEGRGNITVRFVLERDLNDAANSVREKVSEVMENFA